jgi:hypothetical protein
VPDYRRTGESEAGAPYQQRSVALPRESEQQPAQDEKESARRKEIEAGACAAG